LLERAGVKPQAVDSRSRKPARPSRAKLRGADADQPDFIAAK
jgi:hypothetical protein